jgi:hypothetical protein
MKRHKEIFHDFRNTIGNHYDKAIVRYQQSQNADKEQINHISGKDVQRWK